MVTDFGHGLPQGIDATRAQRLTLGLYTFALSHVYVFKRLGASGELPGPCEGRKVAVACSGRVIPVDAENVKAAARCFGQRQPAVRRMRRVVNADGLATRHLAARVSGHRANLGSPDVGTGECRLPGGGVLLARLAPDRDSAKWFL